MKNLKTLSTENVSQFLTSVCVATNEIQSISGYVDVPKSVLSGLNKLQDKLRKEEERRQEQFFEFIDQNNTPEQTS